MSLDPRRSQYEIVLISVLKKSIINRKSVFRDYFIKKHKGFKLGRMDSCWRQWHQEGKDLE